MARSRGDRGNRRRRLRGEALEHGQGGLRACSRASAAPPWRRRCSPSRGTLADRASDTRRAAARSTVCGWSTPSCRLFEHPRLALEPLVEAGGGRRRAPADLGDPELGSAVGVARHHVAEFLNLRLDAVQRRPVRVQSGDVEVCSSPPRPGRRADRGSPRRHVAVARHPSEDDLGLRVLALDRGARCLQQLPVIPGSRVREPVILQVGLIPDLVGPDRKRGLARVPRAEARPVAAAWPVMADERSSGRSARPELVYRGLRRIALGPARASP